MKRRRWSVVHLLVVIIAVPVLSLPGFAWSVVHDRNQQAAAAGRTTEALQSVLLLDRLRYSVWTEDAGLAIPMFTRIATLTPEQEAAIGPRLLAPASTITGATDTALAAVRRDGLRGTPGALAGVERLVLQLPALRQLSTGAQAEAGQLSGAVKILSASKGYAAITTGLIDLERTAIRRISSGSLGTAPAAQLRADAQIRAVGDLNLQVNHEQVTYYELLFSNGASQTGLANLRDAVGAVNTLAANLPADLSPRLAALWGAVETDPEVVRFRRTVSDYLTEVGAGRTPQLDISTASVVRMMTVAGGSIAFTDRMSTLMTTAVQVAADQARADRDEAVTRARIAWIGASGAVLVSVAVLLVVGGVIRRRLGALADSARRLSAGQLEVMAVRGPREVAYASEGLNDAVHGLREITEKAGLIAAGDLTDPALERPSPGPLGAALHASFERVVQAVREREALQRQLAHDASHDALTGLPNRTEAEARLREALERAVESRTRVGLLFVDLDHFKEVNDTHGHHAGDAVLRVAAERMVTMVRGGDPVCRLGGDEFVVILGDVAASVAAATGERIVQAVREPVRYGDTLLTVGASVGIAVWDAEDDVSEPDVDGLLEDLLFRADRAVYRAKAAGRNTAVF